MTSERADVIVVGAGPVGLHAALKTAVLNSSVIVVDKGRRFSRIAQAEHVANLPALPAHVSGEELLERGRASLKDFKDATGKDLVTLLEDTEAVTASRDEDGFHVRVRAGAGVDARERDVHARVLVLATGIVDRKPGVSQYRERGHATVTPWIHDAGIGYCVLCEGWSVAGKRTAVVGKSPSAARVAADLSRHFEGDVTLLTDGTPVEGEVDVGRVRKAGVGVEERVIREVRDEPDAVVFELEDGTLDKYRKAFIALGWYKVNNEIAVALGAATTSEGFVCTDGNSEVLDSHGARIPGLFAVGDVRADRWKQIVIGWGDAETAVIAAYAEKL